MKKLLSLTLIIVSTLACVAPAGAQVPKNGNNANSCNTQSSNRAEQTKKCGVNISSTANQSTTSNDRITGAQPVDRGKPKNPRPAGSW